MPRASRIRPSSFQAAADISMVAARWPSSVRARRRCPSLMVARWARRVASLVSSSGPRVSRKRTIHASMAGYIVAWSFFWSSRRAEIYPASARAIFADTDTGGGFSVHPSSASNRAWRLLRCSASSDALSNRCRQSATNIWAWSFETVRDMCACNAATHVIMQAKFSWLSCYRVIVVNHINWFILLLMARPAADIARRLRRFRPVEKSWDPSFFAWRGHQAGRACGHERNKSWQNV